MTGCDKEALLRWSHALLSNSRVHHTSDERIRRRERYLDAEALRIVASVTVKIENAGDLQVQLTKQPATR